MDKELNVYVCPQLEVEVISIETSIMQASGSNGMNENFGVIPGIW